MMYRYKTGMFAWVMFRITGLLLVFYLSMHIIVISNLMNPAKFDATMEFLGSWVFRLLEVGLLGVVIYHSMNGIRIFIIDFFDGALYQAKLFWVLMGVALVLFAMGAYPMVHHALYWKDKQQSAQVITDKGVVSLTLAEEDSRTIEHNPTGEMSNE